MEKLYQIFVSSTYSDLADERAKVREAIAKSGHIPAGMELFPASSQKQFSYIKRVIDRCDYYILVIGGRYGSLTDDDISFTEMEYHYALSLNIPILVFLHKNPKLISVEKSETGLTLAKKLEKFRILVSTERLVDFWENSNDLAVKVTVALVQEMNLNPSVGWIRGNNIVDPKIINELEELREQNRIFRSEIEYKIESVDFEFPDEVESIDSLYEIRYELKLTDKKIDDVSKIFEENTIIFEQVEKLYSLSWKDIFLISAQFVDTFKNQKKIVNMLLLYISQIIDKTIHINNADKFIALTPLFDTDEIRHQFEALDLIYTEEKPSSEMSLAFVQLQDEKINNSKWTLTSKGRKFLAWNKSKKRN